VNPWLIAIVAAGALWLLFGRNTQPASAAAGEPPLASPDLLGGGDSGTAVALPPGTGTTSGAQTTPADTQTAIVSTYTAEPVGTSVSGGPSTDTGTASPLDGGSYAGGGITPVNPSTPTAGGGYAFPAWQNLPGSPVSTIAAASGALPGPSAAQNLAAGLTASGTPRGHGAVAG